MNGIVTFTLSTGRNAAETIAKLTDEVATLGFRTTLVETETGEELHLPNGTYACPIQIDDQMEQLEALYRNLVRIMRNPRVRGRYLINLAATPADVRGEL